MKSIGAQAHKFYQAMLARDARFDGKFFVAVKTTRIYCRPICPAKPKLANVEFFMNHFDAERAGYRPSLRCRPESAPRSSAWQGKSATVQRAMKILATQDTLRFSEDQFAKIMGVTARHLRRLFNAEIGRTPKQIAFDYRLNLARSLIAETELSISDVAFASGFKSIRRFNASFKDRFTKKPSEIRRTKVPYDSSIRVYLSYRPPFDFGGLMHFYESHRVGNLEWFDASTMHRVVHFAGQTGIIKISDEPDRSRILLEIDFPDLSHIHSIVRRVRALFDLDSDPHVIAETLATNAEMKSIVEKHPGIRLPSGWEPFEIAICTVLGQLVSVDRGRMLVHELVEMLGVDSTIKRNGIQIKLFPTAQQIVDADLTPLKTTSARKQTLKAFAQAILDKTLTLEATQDVQTFIATAKTIRGVGPWTANYIAMKALRATDAFPATDLILARALEIHSPQMVERMSPWRGYAAALFWREYAGALKKSKKRGKA